MTALMVTAPAKGDALITPDASDHQKKLTIRTLTGHKSIKVRYAPQEWTQTAMAASYQHVNRPGRADDIQRQYEPTPVLAMTITLARPDYFETDIEDDIEALEEMADQVQPVVIGGYGRRAGPYVISSLEVDVTDLVPGTNDAARATAKVEFTELVGVAIPTGPTKGGGKHPKKPKHIPSTYTVKRKDTLSGIALKVLGDASLWRKIAAINHLRHPQHLKVGEVLKMPKDN